MSTNEEDNQKILKLGEYHPATDLAMEYIKLLKSDSESWVMTVRALSSLALSGNRICEICVHTLKRLEKGELVSDTYILGLAWFLKEFKEVK